MKQKDISPLEALQRIKLMMEYDMSKTLSENKTPIYEQSAKSDFPICIRLFNLETDEKGQQYLKGPSLGKDKKYSGYKFYKNNKVFDTEGKEKYYVCENNSDVIVTDNPNQAIAYEGRKGFEKIIAYCNEGSLQKLKPGSLGEVPIENITSSIKNAKGFWNDKEKDIENALKQIPTISDLCKVNTKIGGLLNFLDGVTNNPSEWAGFTKSLEALIKYELGEGSSSSGQTSSGGRNQTTSINTGKIYPIPPQLKDKNGVIKFQTWVGDTLKKPEYLGPKGVDGWFGLYTKGAWEHFGSEYLKQNTNVVTQIKPTTQTKKEPDYGAETIKRPNQGETQSTKLNVDTDGGYETEFVEDGTY